MVVAIIFLIFYAVIGNALYWKKNWQLQWNHRSCKVLIRILGVTVVYSGKIPKAGLVAANHLGYLDIFALGSIAPFAFVTSVDISSKGFAGFVIRASGSVPVERRKIMVVKKDAKALSEVCKKFPLVVFPEATSNRQGNVGTFRSSLFQVASANTLPVIPTAITYDNSEMCFVKGMNLFKHLGRHKGFIYVYFLQSNLLTDRKKAAAVTETYIKKHLSHG